MSNKVHMEAQKAIECPNCGVFFSGGIDEPNFMRCDACKIKEPYDRGAKFKPKNATDDAMKNAQRLHIARREIHRLHELIEGKRHELFSTQTKLNCAHKALKKLHSHCVKPKKVHIEGVEIDLGEAYYESEMYDDCERVLAIVEGDREISPNEQLSDRAQKFLNAIKSGNPIIDDAISMLEQDAKTREQWINWIEKSAGEGHTDGED